MNVNWTEMERVHELNKFTFLKKQWMWPELNSFFQIWMWSEFYSWKKGTYNALYFGYYIILNKNLKNQQISKCF